MVTVLLGALWGPSEAMACCFLGVPLLSLPAGQKDLLKKDLCIAKYSLVWETAFCWQASLTQHVCLGCCGWEDLLCWAARWLFLCLQCSFKCRALLKGKGPQPLGSSIFFHATSSAFAWFLGGIESWTLVNRQDPGTAAAGSTGVCLAKNRQAFAGLRYTW